jgi:hypothetical protein
MTFGQMHDLIRDGGPQGRRTGWPVKDYIEAIYPKSTSPSGDPHLEWRTTLAVIPYTPSNLDLFALDWEAQTPCVKTPITTGDDNG